MGLLDLFNSPEGQQALGLLAAGGPQTDPSKTGFGQRLAAASGFADQWKQRQADAEMEKQNMAMLRQKMEETAAMAGLHQEQASQLRAKAAQEQRNRELIARAGQIQPGMGATNQVNDALPAEMRIGAQPALQQAGKIDYTSLMQQGVPFDSLKDLAATRNLGREEVARVQEVEGQNGQKLVQGYDKFNRPVGEPVAAYLAPQLVNQGDRQTFVKPSAGVSLQTFQDPNSKASNALGWANFGLSKQREAREAANANNPSMVWNESLGGFVNPKTRQVLPALDAQSRPMEGAGAKMTEDQGKATGWLIQADNAFKNMIAVTSKNPDAARPGFNDALAAIPSMGAAGGLANMMRGADRQKFMQASNSLSEALLRAATGAGVNKDEAAQKVKELTPQIGDDAETIAQKNASIPLYIESLKVRAGSGAKKASSIMSNTGGDSGGWSMQKVD